ncbi:hypothetical protein HK104_010054 [Borealophlyctis nickersoniae]|nr:hypothetical protein HK104_010054 [Borealophlyctis nickersoniae]
MTDSSGSHLLSLKVMRLSRPTFVLKNPTPFEAAPSLPGEAALLAASANQVTELAVPPNARTEDLLNLGLSDANPNPPLRIREFGLSDVLSLPGSFGNIYLGETFSSYLCVNNESGAAVQEVGIKAELQTSSQRFTLADTLATLSTPTFSNLPAGNVTPPRSPAPTPARVSLLPTQSAEFLVHHEIKELGIHILVCSVHYTTPDRERKFFRKFYKFQVLNPLAVKTKVNTLQDGRVFLEAQVQNMAGAPMYLERMRFESNELFEYQDLNSVVNSAGESTGGVKDVIVGGMAGNGGERKGSGLGAALVGGQRAADVGLSVFGSASYLNPQDTRQYLYMLRPKTPHDPLARTTSTMGKLDILWRTHLGQTGRLQTSQLSRKVPPIDPFEITVLSLPKTVKAEVPFTLPCRIRNNLTSAIRLTISGVKSKMSSVLLRGPSDHTLGNIEPLEHLDFELEFFPLLTGLHKITGLKISESLSGTSRDVDSLADVYVVLGDEIY